MFFSCYYFLSPDNHDNSDRKITSSELVEMLVSLLLQAGRGLNTSQVSCQDNSYVAGMPHWKLRKTSHTWIPAWKKPREKDLDLPWESSFSSCHSEGLPRRTQCHLDCWGSKEGWFWMVTQSHHGSVSVCLAAWNSFVLSFVGKKWAWKATGNGAEGKNEWSAPHAFASLLTLSQWGSCSTQAGKPALRKLVDFCTHKELTQLPC